MSLWLPRQPRRGTRAAWGLGARDLAWLSSPDATNAVRCATHAEAIPQALAQLTPRFGLDVIAGNDIAVHWLQSPPSSIASLDELRLVAAARCAHLYGGSPADWWIAADWNATSPFVCAALPKALIAPLQQRLAAAGIEAQWHTAWGVACGSSSNTFPAQGWSALRSPTRFLLWHCRQGHVDCLGTHSLSAEATHEHANAQALQQIHLEGTRDASLTNEPLHWMQMGVGDDAEPTEAAAALGLGVLLGGAAP